MTRALHHLDLWVDDVATAEGEWGWLLAWCGWQRDAGVLSWAHPDGTYVFMERSPDQHEVHDRLRPGINHLAMIVETRDALDRMRAESTDHGWHEMYADRYPHAGGEQHLALYLENSEGFEVEVVVGAWPPPRLGGMGAGRWVVALESRWDAVRDRRRADRTPDHFRIESYGGHGSASGVVVRGRVVDDPPLPDAVEGEGVRAAVGRTVRAFLTDELPGVPLRVRVGGAEASTVTDAEGYFRVRLDDVRVEGPWVDGTVELAGAYRGLDDAAPAPVRVRVPTPGAAFGVISDVDDTILETGVQRVGRMVLQTLTGSALTRTPFPGAVELYRDLARGEVNPVFYVSSSPWNLHAFLDAFLVHRGFPLGPVLLRDLLGSAAGREEKHGRIREVLELHPDLPFVLVGDSGERDPEIYADIVREHPGRVLAVYIRETRLDPGDGRVEQVSDAWDHDVPFVLAADSDAVRRHAEALGLLG